MYLPFYIIITFLYYTADPDQRIFRITVALKCQTLGRGRSQRFQRTVLRVNLVVGDHAVTQMMINMANDLPHTSTSSIHDESLANAIVDGGSVLLGLSIHVAVAVHVEDVRCAAVGHDVPEYFIALTHLEDRIVGKGVAVDRICQRYRVNRYSWL